MRNNNLSISFPIINITDKNWHLTEELLEFIAFDEFIYTKNKEIFYKGFYNKEFCDCNGNIFKIIDLKPPTNFWRKVFSFLPNVYKVELIFEPTNKTLSINKFRNFILDRLEQLEDNDIISEWKNDIQNANTIEEMIHSMC